MPIDPSLVDNEALNQSIESMSQYLDNTKQEEEAQEVIQRQDQAEETQALSEQADPRNADQWGLKAVAEELKSVAAGGVQDTASFQENFDLHLP